MHEVEKGLNRPLGTRAGAGLQSSPEFAFASSRQTLAKPLTRAACRLRCYDAGAQREEGLIGLPM